MEGSLAISEAYSDQCGQGDGIDGERFMKIFWDRVSMTRGCKRFASGIASSMFMLESVLGSSRSSLLAASGSMSDLIEDGGYSQA
jgi:hypothetical protein